MNKAFPSCNANTSSSYAYCTGGVSTARVNSNGYVFVYAGSGYCYVSDAGYSNCD